MWAEQTGQWSHGPSPSGMPCSHLRGQGAPPRLSPGEGIHNRPQATRGLLLPPRATEGQGVHTPSLEGEILVRPEPCGLWTRSALPSSSSKIDFAIPHVSASGRPAPSQCQRLQILVSYKVQFLLPACHCARSLITLPTEASGHGA